MNKRAIINQLEQNGQVYQDLLSEFSQEESVWKPEKDRWSLLEIVSHLIDIEKEDFRFILKITLFTPETVWPSFDIEAWVVKRK